MDPQTFYVIKGIFGVIGVFLLIAHMNRGWAHFDATGGVGQRLRHITLFYFAVLITAASVEQVRDSIDQISLHSVGALGGAVLLIVTTAVSIVEAAQQRHHHKRG